MDRIGGTIEVKANGDLYSAKGSWTYNLGIPKRTEVLGSDTIHGFKEEPQAPFIEGTISDRGDLDLPTLLEMKDATVTLALANGKIIVLRDAFFSGDGNVTTAEGEIASKFVGASAEEVR